MTLELFGNQNFSTSFINDVDAVVIQGVFHFMIQAPGEYLIVNHHPQNTSYPTVFPELTNNQINLPSSNPYGGGFPFAYSYGIPSGWAEPQSYWDDLGPNGPFNEMYQGLANGNYSSYVSCKRYNAQGQLLDQSGFTIYAGKSQG